MFLMYHGVTTIQKHSIQCAFQNTSFILCVVFSSNQKIEYEYIIFLKIAKKNQRFILMNQA